MVVFLGIRPGQVPEEPQPEGLNPFRDWQAACSVPNRLICSVSGVRDPKDFPQTPATYPLIISILIMSILTGLPKLFFITLTLTVIARG